MRIPLIAAALLIALTSNLPVHAGGGPECWRRGGPPALAALMKHHAEAIQRHRDGQVVENWATITAELDAVAAQRDAWASGLYWYTDLVAAKAAARREDKPILSLRLLGRLDADLSCANSRFFRTTLYPVAGVNERLRERFVLHWSSERPAPVISVDFGDGRKLQRTVTGNSAHYLMTPDGAVVDVLPGLYAAKPFAAWLDDAGGLARRVTALSPSDRPAAIRAYHAAKRDELDTDWVADVRAARTPGAGAAPFVAPKGHSARSGAQPVRISAVRAGERAISKGAIEMPVVKLVSSVDLVDPGEAVWSAIADRHADEAALDPATVALIRAKRPAGDVEALVSMLQRTIARDTVRNEYNLHRQLHAWFADGVAPSDFEGLNRRVYAELFLTPRSDPWLGLAPEDAWSALDDDGLSAGTVAAR